MSNPNIAVVFDIETKDTAPTGVILSLGVVMFDITKVQPFEELVAQGINIYFNQKQQEEAGRTISEDTMNWWASQGEAAQECLDNPNQVDCLDLYLELNRLYRTLNFQPDRKNTRWFSRGYFDIAFMDDFCRTFGMDQMMKFWCWRDSRSFLEGAGIGANNAKLKKPAGFVEHNSHHDSAFEAFMIQRLLNNAPLEYEAAKIQPLVYTYSKPCKDPT